MLNNSVLTATQALYLRLFVGGVFGLILARLLTTSMLTISLNKQIICETLVFVSFVIWASAGNMRRFSLLLWSITAFGLIGFLAWYGKIYSGQSIGSSALGLFIYPFLFILHELICSADQARKIIAPYSVYFEQAWKHGIQLFLAVIFTALFWKILWLGSILLHMIGFEWLSHVLENQYFFFPITGLAMGAAIQLSDVQIKLVSQVRTLVLGVLAWLLPVMTLISFIFAISLCWSGLAPLWATKLAVPTLLSACILLVLLINAVYQQGDQERFIHVVLKSAVRLASLLLLLFAILAAYSLYLRIQQYGLTPHRILASVGIIITFLFGLGYSIAAITPGRWMHRLETINIGLAIFNVLLFFALLSPIADPYRLSVNNQVARLQSGHVAVDKFDWKFLRFGNYWGRHSLDILQKSGNTEAIRSAATKAKAMRNEEYSTKNQEKVTKKLDPNYLKLVFSKEGKIPESFLKQAFDLNSQSPKCFKAIKVCDVALIDLNEDEKSEIVIYDDSQLYIFVERDGIWEPLFSQPYYIGDVETDFAAGRIKVSKREWNDLKIGERKIQIRAD